MQTHFDNLIGKVVGQLQPLGGVSVTVTTSAGAPATIYKVDGVTPLTGLTTDAKGYYEFKAPNGHYTLTFSGPRIDTFTREIQLYDVDDAIPVTAAELAATSGAAKIGATGGKTVQQEINDLHAWDAAHIYTLPAATASTLGGVKVGAGLTVDGSGLLATTGVGVNSINGVTADGTGAITINTDNLPESGTPTNQWFTAARVRAVVLTGLSTATNAVITAADSILTMAGKLQAQISANTTAIGTKQDASAKDASGGFAGLTGFAINLKNSTGTVTSTLSSAATVARSIAFPDKSGTVAMTSDISGATPALTAYFESSPQTITYTGALTIAHGMGTTPKLIQGFLKCLTAENGYSAGDIVPFGFNITNGGVTTTVTITSDATNLNIRYGGGTWTLLNKSTGSSAGTVTLSNWAYIVRAWA